MMRSHEAEASTIGEVITDEMDCTPFTKVDVTCLVGSLTADLFLYQDYKSLAASVYQRRKRNGYKLIRQELASHQRFSVICLTVQKVKEVRSEHKSVSCICL